MLVKKDRRNTPTRKELEELFEEEKKVLPKITFGEKLTSNVCNKNEEYSDEISVWLDELAKK